MSYILNLFYGFTVNIFDIISYAYIDKCLGTLYYPDNIFWYNFGVYWSSKGKQPQSMAYKITPQLHISTSKGSYLFFPSIISGAA